MAYSPPIKDASTLVSAFFEKDRFAEGGRFADLHSAWDSIVGDRFAAHSSPEDVIKGILYIEVEHPGWIQLLQFRQAGILEAVKRSYPELKLKSILFRLARDRKPCARHIAEGVRSDSCMRVNGEKMSGTASSDRDETVNAPDGRADPNTLTPPGMDLSCNPKVAPEVRTMMADLKKLVDSGNKN